MGKIESIEIHIKNKYICSYCGKEFKEDYRIDKKSKKFPPRFCSSRCAHAYASTFIDHAALKKVTCSICRGTFNIKINQPSNKYICKECRDSLSNSKKEIKNTKKLLEEKIIRDNQDYHLSKDINDYINLLESLRKKRKINSYKYYNYLSHLTLEEIPIEKRKIDFFKSNLIFQKNGILERLGFIYNNKNYEDSYYKLRENLYKEYILLKKSADQIEKENNLGQGSLSPKIFYYLGIIKRGNSQALKMSLEGKSKVPVESRILGHKDPFKSYPSIKSFNKFKEGYHTTWENKIYYLRSSYEFKFAEFLDKNKISYECNNKIIYWDSTKKENRAGFPDFYLPAYKLFIEIKGDRFYIPQNLKDRSLSVKKQGFEFYCILNNLYFLKNNFPDFLSIKKGFYTDYKKDLEILIGFSI